MRAFCPQCRHVHTFLRVGINHWAHLGVTILTFGLWMIPWFSMAAYAFKHPWRCRHCRCNKPRFDTLGTAPGEFAWPSDEKDEAPKYKPVLRVVQKDKGEAA